MKWLEEGKDSRVLAPYLQIVNVVVVVDDEEVLVVIRDPQSDTEIVAFNLAPPLLLPDVCRVCVG